MKLPLFRQLQPTLIPAQLEQMLIKFRQEMTEAIESQQSLIFMLNLLNQHGLMIEQFWSPCAHLNAVIGSDEWRDCYSKCLPLLTAYDTFIHQNEALYNLMNHADQKHLSLEQKKMLDDFLLNCRLSGIGLSDDKRQQVETIFERLDKLSQLFDNHVIDSQKCFKYHTEYLEDLAGIPEYVVENAAQRAKSQQLSGYLFSLDQPTYLAIVTYAKQPELRKKFYNAYNSRASEHTFYDEGKFDNTPIIQETLQLRQELANLIGLENYAEYSLSSKMAKTKDRVEKFIHELLESVVPVAKKDMQVLSDYAKEKGHKGLLQPWDIPYYVQCRQKEIFCLDQEALRVYFPLKHVMQSINHLLKTLYQVQLELQTDVDLWHPDAECYFLKQGDQVLGALYCDWFSREGKRGGAWMDTMQTHTSDSLPITTLTCNFAVPAPGQAAGLTHDELTTLLHELGHCLHHLLSDVKEFSVSGVHGVEWDAVELPSQWMENWGWQADWIKIFSHHMQTGESLPSAQFEQLLAMKNDLVGLFLLRQLMFAKYDMMIHTQVPPSTEDVVNQQYFDILQRYAVTPIDPEQRFPHAFSHIFAGGYAAGYYSYLWADVLSCDVFSWFEKNMTNIGECGQLFRSKLLSKGGSLPALDAFVNLLGREPNQDALLRSYGLIQ
jgi:oligopeptidase A